MMNSCGRAGVRTGIAVLAAVGVVAGCLAWGKVAPAQGNKGKKGPDIEKVSGKIAAVERKGKSATLTIDKEGGGTLDLLLTPKMNAVVTAPGDASFFQPKAWVSSDRIVMANQQLFGHQFTVHFGNQPAAQCRSDPKAAEVYLVCGQVVSADDESVTLQCGRDGPRKIKFEEGHGLAVKVSTTKHDHLIAEGAMVDVEGVTRADKYLPSKVVITLKEPLTADDLHPDKKAARAKPVATKGGKKPAEASEDEKPGDTRDKEKDPFKKPTDPLGLSKKKNSKGDEKTKDAKDE